MPVPLDELSVFFDRHYSEMRNLWDRMAEGGHITNQAKHRREALMDDIGAILRALGEGQAVLNYRPEEQRETPVAAWRPRVIGDD